MITNSDIASVPGEKKQTNLRRWMGLAVILTGTFVAVLDNFIVFVAIPNIRSSLRATFAEAEFIVAAYTLTFAIGIITGARLGDIYGRRRVFSIGFSAFTVASALCALAPSPEALIFFRIIQGLSAAVLSPQVLALIRMTFTDARQRAIAFAWMGAVIGIASVTGQIIGGFIIAADIYGSSWRPIFMINVPIGICAVACVSYFVEESKSPQRHRLDISGAILSALAFSLLLYPLVVGRKAGWPAWSFVMLALSLLMLVVFALHQHRKSRRGASPLIEIDLFRDRAFVIGLVLTFLFYATLSPLFLSFTYLVQIGFGQAPLQAAFDFLPLAVAFALTSLATGRLTHISSRKVLLVGSVTTVVGASIAYLICLFGKFFVPTDLSVALVVLGIGQGLFMTPVANAILSGIRDQYVGSASGILTTTQRAGNALGVALLEVPFFVTLDQAHAAGFSQALAYTKAFASVALWVAAVTIVVTALLFSLPANRSVRSA